MGSQEGKEIDWQRCEAVAKVIANCPAQAQSLPQYYTTIAPQVSPVATLILHNNSTTGKHSLYLNITQQ